ncbi:MAG: HAD family hydrolase [Candidatus Nanohaloarchaea archaeon]|nr:HAD family hydrolase [Candidatus Nanohaloarchaea archaeon]
MKGVIFDADHTLYTPEADRAYERKFAFLAEQTGVEEDALADAWAAAVEAANTGGHEKVERKTLIHRMLEHVGIDPADELVDEAYDLFWETVVEDLTYEDELPGMLERLNERFEVLAIATDEFPEALEMKLSTVFADPDALFDDIVTPEDTGEMKPSTAFFRRILDAHGVAAGDAVMVGDSWDRDLAPAQELGMTTVLVDADTSDEPLERDGNGTPDPDHEVESVLEVERIVEAEA